VTAAKSALSFTPAVQVDIRSARGDWPVERMQMLRLEVEAGNLAYYDIENKAWEIEEIEYVIYVGPSSCEKALLRDSFKISGA